MPIAAPDLVAWPDHPADHDRSIVIGLVNNMSPRAMRTTERQFRDILAAASPGRPIELRLFTVHADRAIATTASDAASPYRPVDELFATRLDGLIVTGMEPRAATLPEEAAWPTLTRLIDRAVRQRIPAVWSCLAAHAAVLYLDDIERLKLPAKLSGLFDCRLVSKRHPLASNVPGQWHCPHSRHYGLSEQALLSHGYEVISHSDEAGVDMFARTFAQSGQPAARDDDAPFLFCQGHPEYGPEALLREYVRDVGRYLDGGQGTAPGIPTGYLDDDTVRQLTAIRADAAAPDRDAVLASTQAVAKGARFTGAWRHVAVAVYASWLGSITTHRRALAA